MNGRASHKSNEGKLPRKEMTSSLTFYFQSIPSNVSPPQHQRNRNWGWKMEVLNRSHTNACTDSNGGKAAPHFIKTCKNRCFTKKENQRLSQSKGFIDVFFSNFQKSKTPNVTSQNWISLMVPIPWCRDSKSFWFKWKI